MKFEKYINYVLPTVLLILAAVFNSASFAYASCLAMALGYTKEHFDRVVEVKSTKTDDVLRHKVEQMEAALSAMITREKARGW